MNNRASIEHPSPVLCKRFYHGTKRRTSITAAAADKEYVEAILGPFLPFYELGC